MLTFLSTPVTGEKISKYEIMEMVISSNLVIVFFYVYTLFKKINDTHLKMHTIHFVVFKEEKNSVPTNIAASAILSEWETGGLFLSHLVFWTASSFSW